MLKEYLRNLNNAVHENPSQIKQLIQDLPKLKDQLLFSKLNLKEDRDIYCNLLELLMKRVAVTSRRSKQAFTSMWDNLRECFELILIDGLTINDIKIDENISRVLRKILQMNITPGRLSISNLNCWLAMDLDTQLKEITYSHGLNHVSESENELNLKTLCLYCDEFNVPEFPKVFLNLSEVNSDLINVFFKPKYFNTSIISEYIETKGSISYELIINLKNIPSTIWLDFSSETIIELINKLTISESSKDTCAIFELFEVISASLDYRNDNIKDSRLLNSLIEIANMDTIMSDVVQSKFWCFVSSLLSCECVCDSLLNFEPRIINTLESDNIKAKISVCRVISLYWHTLQDHDLIVSMLLDTAMKTENNKLKWNIAINLMNYSGTRDNYLKIKEFWLAEMEIFGNFKVIHSYTKLLMKWSDDCGEELTNSNSESFEIVWTFLNRLKLFINSNFGNLECEDGEGLVEIANKLETIIKSILIGGEDRIKFEA